MFFVGFSNEVMGGSALGLGVFKIRVLYTHRYGPLSFRLSPFRRPTVPFWRDVITFMFIEASKDDLEVRRPIFPAAHLTSLALL